MSDYSSDDFQSSDELDVRFAWSETTGCWNSDSDKEKLTESELRHPDWNSDSDKEKY
ncbi:MAG: hypothetical protein WCK78_03020 [Paludibacter sp.]